MLFAPFAGGLALAGISVGACSQILGVTDGLPYPDGGDGASEALVDARGSVDVHASRDASDGHAFDTGTGECVRTKNFCEARCGTTPDNCGNIVVCPCEGGLTCIQGACGCTPESISVTCDGHNCGTFQNNCGQSVACGSHGSSQCEHTTDLCEMDGSTCCTPDPPGVTCSNQCGATLTNNCGESVDCSCGDSAVCVSGACCNPVSNAEWCASRCGLLDNNCGQPVNCGGCDSGVCNNNSCNCNPEPPATTCAGVTCGLVQNNCNQLVPCGISGTTDCPIGQECESDSGTCCTPNPAPCNGICDTTVMNCGRVVSCGTCPSAGVCVDGGCCGPERLTAACDEAGASCGEVQNNCGATVQCNDTCTGSGGACAAGEAGPNGCCVDDGTACTGLCSGAVTNNCGLTVHCTNACASGESCGDGGSCCNDNGAGCTDGGECCDGNCNAVDGGTSLCCNLSGGTCEVDSDCCSASCNFEAGNSDAGTCN